MVGRRRKGVIRDGWCRYIFCHDVIGLIVSWLLVVVRYTFCQGVVTERQSLRRMVIASAAVRYTIRHFITLLMHALFNTVRIGQNVNA